MSKSADFHFEKLIFKEATVKAKWSTMHDIIPLVCMCAGIFWNLSSKDNLKEKLAKETLTELTERILIRLSGDEDSEGIHQSPSEAEIFYNTTGCLRCTSVVCVFSLCSIFFYRFSISFWFICVYFFSHDHILHFGNLFWQDTNLCVRWQLL